MFYNRLQNECISKGCNSTFITFPLQVFQKLRKFLFQLLLGFFVTYKLQPPKEFYKMLLKKKKKTV